MPLEAVKRVFIFGNQYGERCSEGSWFPAEAFIKFSRFSLRSRLNKLAIVEMSACAQGGAISRVDGWRSWGTKALVCFCKKHKKRSRKFIGRYNYILRYGKTKFPCRQVLINGALSVS